MDITEIPFNKFIEIRNSGSEDSSLELAFNNNMKNHLETFHASAQFALAEACSGVSLKENFPHLADAVVPVLRKSDVKFKQPAESDIKAISNLSAEAKEKFEDQLNKKSRAIIVVPVEIRDVNGTVTMVGNYEWFVQKI
jgi:acyl-coenzyme A thioesterase PaaI-like protein